MDKCFKSCRWAIAAFMSLIWILGINSSSAAHSQTGNVAQINPLNGLYPRRSEEFFQEGQARLEEEIRILGQEDTESAKPILVTDERDIDWMRFEHLTRKAVIHSSPSSFET
ncbi:MAG: hypothetical protein IGR76_14095 [Synechococcales cyanobacterium T60_A2020_003]|nr:hypothetical protein [Synechococcales cyanobacterium T60_A2020_003]